MAENSGSGLPDRLETDFINVRSALRLLGFNSLSKGITDTALDSLLRIEATLLMNEKALQNYAELKAAMTALATTYEHYACENDPEAPCVGAPDLLWPDDWCLPCYTRETVRAALAAAVPEGT